MVYGRKFRRSFRGLYRRRTYRRRQPFRLYRRRFRLRRALRRRYTRRAAARISPSKTGLVASIIPSTQFVKFRYYDMWEFVSVGGSATQKFYTNNVYDPIVGASASNCSGFTAMTNLYSRFLVKACKITAVMTHCSNTTDVWGYIWMPDLATNIDQTITKDFINESPQHMVSKLVLPYIVNPSVTPTKLSIYRTIKSVTHKDELEPDSFSHAYDGGPAVLCQARVGWVQMGTPASTNIRTHIRITYYTMLYDRKPLDVY